MSDLIRKTVRCWQRGSQHQVLSIGACGILGCLLPAALGIFTDFPEPLGHDEHAYVLQADTFSQGRLTNPTHPLWLHFASPHILHEPTYCSKFPPGQGLVLAAGQWLGGHPAYGIWLGSGLFAASLCWMLQAWTRPRWATVGTLLMILNIGINSYWSQSYWGGMVAAAGGAFFFGGFRRTIKRPQVGSAVLMAVGVITLANTRPFEGAVVTVPAIVVFAYWMFWSGSLHSFSEKMYRTVLPGGIVVGLGAASMLAYNYSTTGDFCTMPYTVYHQKYFSAPLFIFQQENQGIQFANARLKRVDETYPPREVRALDFFYAPRGIIQKQTVFLLGNIITVTLLFIPWMLSERWLRFAIISWALLIVIMSFANFHGAVHYSAPTSCLVYLFVVEALRRIHILRRGESPSLRIKARYLLASLLALWVMWDGVAILRQLKHTPTAVPKVVEGQRFSRRQLMHHLSNLSGQHLVVVTYAQGYSVHDEWVYNQADIDQQKIVWAHARGTSANQKLRIHYDDRSAWRLHLSPTATTFQRWEE